MRNLVGIVLLSLFFLLHGKPAVAQGLQILTEENPPSSMTGPDKKPTGYGVEIVTEIQKRVKNKDPIKIVAWIKAYDTILNNPGVVVFSMAKTKEREPLFQWVGPIIENSWIFVAKKSAKLKVISLDDAKKLQGIGVLKDYASDKYLTGQGFTNLEKVTEYSANVRRIAAGKMQAFASSRLTYQRELTDMGENVDDYEVLMEYNTVQMYIAHSKESDKNIVKAWQSAFDSMKKDGTVEVLLKKWVPNAKLPPSAKPASS